MANPNITPTSTANAHCLLSFTGIPGPVVSTASGLTDPSFHVVWYEFDIMHPAVSAVAGVHQGSGRIAQSAFRVVILDHNTTGLFNAYTNGNINPTVKIGLTQRVGPTVSPLLVFELTNVRISEFSQMEWSQIKDRKLEFPFIHGLNLEDAPSFRGSRVVELFLDPQQTTVSYTPIGTDGTVEGVLSQKYNALTLAIA